MQLIRPASFVVSVLIVSAAGRAQDWRDDDSIWGFGSIGGPHRAGPRPPDLPPIVPAEWIAIPATSDEPALLVVPWILEPERAAPELGASGWTSKLAPPLASAACAFTTVVAEHDEVRMARLTGARWLVVNDSAHIGDPERRGDRGVPVALKKGANRIFVVDATEGWELELWKPATRCVIGTWDVAWPDAAEYDEDIEYPVFNASLVPIHGLHVHYGHLFVPSAAHPNRVEEWRDGGAIAPLALLLRGHYWASPADGERANSGRGGNRSPVVVYAEEDVEAAREILCDLDSSWDRKRHGRVQRDLGRKTLAGAPQSRIVTHAVLVYGTCSTEDENAALLARARLDQQVLWYACDAIPLLISDGQLLGTAGGLNPAQAGWIRTSVSQNSLVLYGNEDANSAWRELANQSAPVEVTSTGVRAAHPSSIRSGGAGTLFWATIAGSSKVLPWTARPVLGFASSGVDGARLSLALGMLAAQDEFVRVDSDSKSGFSPLPTGK